MDIMNSFSLEGKVALVTGAAYGIGFAIAEAFAAAGAKICFNCRGEKHMEAALKAYADKGIDAHGYYCDVTGKELDKNSDLFKYGCDSSWGTGYKQCPYYEQDK